LLICNALLLSQALDKFNIEKDVAAYIKKEFDAKHNPTWHCIVGRNFGESHDNVAGSVGVSKTFPPLANPGSYVTHETKHFIYFYSGPVAVLLFKSG
jgi:dynein light chain LC8-type